MIMEQETAASFQLAMLPGTLPFIKGYDREGVCCIAEKAGGDFYDIIPLDDDHFLILIGDTSGKEMSAVLSMNTTMSILYALIKKYKYSGGVQPAISLIALLEILNDILRIKARRGHFVTVFTGILNIKTHQFRYTTSGHNPAILYNPGTGKYKELKTNGQLCGIVKTEMYKKNLEEKTEPVSPGDYLIFYTNGITEAQNKQKELYKKHYYDTIHQIKSTMSAGNTVSFLLKGAGDFSQGMPRNDDIILVCLKRNEKD